MTHIYEENIIKTVQEAMEIMELAYTVEDHDKIKLEKNFLDTEKANHFLFYEERKLLGYLSYVSKDEKTVEVIIFVHPKHRRKGIFRGLAAALCDELKENGVELIIFEIARASEYGKKFFETIGAETTLDGKYYKISPQKLDVTAPARHQLTAYNNRDIDGFMANYSQDCIVEDGLGNVLMEGYQSMYHSYQKMFENSPNLHCHLASRIVVGNYILDEEYVTGRAGNEGQSHVVAVYYVENGLITRVRFLR